MALCGVVILIWEAIRWVLDTKNCIRDTRQQP